MIADNLLNSRDALGESREICLGGAGQGAARPNPDDFPTADTDRGVANDFPVHRIWLGANKPGFENVANADKLPAKGATIFCIPMKIGKGTGGPTRIFALLP